MSVCHQGKRQTEIKEKVVEENKTKGRHKKNCRFGENGTIGGEGFRKIIEFSSFTNDEKHGRGGGLRVTFHYFIEPNYD